MPEAQGTFDVELSPREATAAEGADAIVRMTIEKEYHGDLVGSGRGQMLSCMTDVEGSAGYVAMELVEATLSGRQGSFVLQHVGVMSRGDASLEMTVVPDSGTRELAGLSGAIEIEIDDDGTHRYDFTYELVE